MKSHRVELLLVLMGSLLISSNAAGDERLFPENLPAGEWSQFQARGYSIPVTGVIYRGDRPRPINGMPIGGVDTGCFDIESSGAVGWSTIFNHLAPRGGPVNVPLLGLNIDGKTWVLATGEGKRLNNPNNTGEVPKIFPLEIEGVGYARAIDYWGHFPVLDLEFETAAAVSAGARIWSPFVPGDTVASMVPGAVLEIELRNAPDTARRGTLVLNFPGFPRHRPLAGRGDVANVSAPDRPYRPGAPPFDGKVLPETQPVIARPNLGRSQGGKLVIADPSLDGRNEVLVGLKDGNTGRGFLVSFQRGAASWGTPVGGVADYEYEVIDILDGDSPTAIAVADYDGDGKLEIIVGTEKGSVYHYRRRAPGFTNGNIEPRRDYARKSLVAQPTNGTFVSELRVGDVTGDGANDVVFTTGWRPGTQDPAPGAFVLTSGKVVNVASDGQATFMGCALGDYNSDGKLDLAVASKGGSEEGRNYVKIFNFDAEGNVAATESVATFGIDRGPQWLTSGDFDADGRPELLAGSIREHVLWFRRSASPFGTPSGWTPGECVGDGNFSGYSDPYPFSLDSQRTAISVGDDFLSLLWLPAADADSSQLGWKIENWHTGGASDTMIAAGLGDLSGDGQMDVAYWHSSRELGVRTRPKAATDAKPGDENKQDSNNFELTRKTLDKPKGIAVHEATYNWSYALAAVGETQVRTGGGLETDGASWAKIGENLPKPAADGSASLAVDFRLEPGEVRTVRFALGWSAPEWTGTGQPEVAGLKYTHMYHKYYPTAEYVVRLLAGKHQRIFKRIVAWQEAIYGAPEIPGWLADGLVNILHLMTECAVWGQVKPPIDPAFKVEDGLFGMNECPRGCPQIECIPCSFYGNQPLVYFFPDTAVSTLRGYKRYQYEDGRAPWIFGGVTAQTPPFNISTPAKGYQTVLNGACYVVMVDRYWRIRGDDAFLEEFWESVKRVCEFSFNLRPAYGPSQVVSMPTGNVDTEWFEAPEPGWKGYVTHAGGIRMAQAALAKRMARHMEDEAFEKKCDVWLTAGAEALEKHLWAGKYYSNFNEPESGARSDLVFGFQLDGEWIADWHGVPGVFPRNRVRTTLETIRRVNVPLSQSGVVNYANADGTPAAVGGYGTYSYFPPEVMMLAMNYMYEGQRELGIEILYKCMENIHCTHGYTWDAPNIMRGDKDTGERTFGSDYYQDMMLWSVPAALASADMTAPAKEGGLVDRVIKAGRE